ncbi:LptF/LptG family permease [Treponema sp.]|uniref:LptF/LptG family permease n=1 Tax=Treponema sp. TaxID=166 RepID=UPI003F0F8EFE
MKLVFYVLRRFFPVFIGALVFFILILCLTDLFMNLWNYISKNVSSHDVALILLYYIPKVIWYSVPVSMLFATAYMLSDFYARNELLAVFASGVSLFRFSVPLLAVAAAMSFGLFVFEDKIVVPFFAKKTQLQESVLAKEKSLNNSKIVIMAESGSIIYKADFFNNKTESLSGLYVLFRADGQTPDTLVFSTKAFWRNGFWKLDSPLEYKFSDGTFLLSEGIDPGLEERLVEPPATFRNNTISVEQVDTREAREYIEHLEKAGLPSAEEKSVYYKKFSFPFVVFIVVFLAIGLSGKTRKNVLIVSLAMSITAVVLFYVLQMITMLMAKFQVIPPLFGAWSPVVLFIIISCVLLKFART